MMAGRNPEPTKKTIAFLPNFTLVNHCKPSPIPQKHTSTPNHFTTTRRHGHLQRRQLRWQNGCQRPKASATLGGLSEQTLLGCNCPIGYSLPQKTNSLPMKNDGWIKKSSFQHTQDEFLTEHPSLPANIRGALLGTLHVSDSMPRGPRTQEFKLTKVVTCC